MLRSRDHIFGLGLIVVSLDLGLGLMKYRSRSWELVSRYLTMVDDYQIIQPVILIKSDHQIFEPECLTVHLRNWSS